MVNLKKHGPCSDTFFLFNNFKKVRYLIDHSSHLRCVFQNNGFVKLVKAQTLECQSMLLGSTYSTSYKGNFKFLVHCRIHSPRQATIMFVIPPQLAFSESLQVF